MSMTQRDKILIEKAEAARKRRDYFAAAELEGTADTKEANERLHVIASNTYHDEEYFGGLA